MPVRFPLLMATACIIAAIPSYAAAGRLTYQFADQDSRELRYGGGLIGGSFDARLSGSFEVERSPSGEMIITSFDVFIEDPVLLGGPAPQREPDGAPLSYYLFNDPIGLEVKPADDSSRSSLGPLDVPLSEAFEKQTEFVISNISGRLATLRIRSGYRGFVLDAPSISSKDEGFVVQLIPEPASLPAMAICLLATLSIRRAPRQ